MLHRHARIVRHHLLVQTEDRLIVGSEPTHLKMSKEQKYRTALSGPLKFEAPVIHNREICAKISRAHRFTGRINDKPSFQRT